jgi:hypothetical protein
VYDGADESADNDAESMPMRIFCENLKHLRLPHCKKVLDDRTYSVLIDLTHF